VRLGTLRSRCPRAIRVVDASGVAHETALSDQAMRVLDRLPRIACADPKKQLVFTTTGRTPISGWSRAKKQLDREIVEIMKRQALDRGDGPKEIEAIPHWTFHDLRRIVTSGMARLGVPPHIADLILNHKSGKIKGVAAIYNRFEYLAERRAAFGLWGRHVEALVAGKKVSNVVPLAAKPKQQRKA
jgi:integrase